MNLGGTSVNVCVHVNEETNVAVHCGHDDGRYSLKVVGADDHPTHWTTTDLYLVGDRQDLLLLSNLIFNAAMALDNAEETTV